MVKHCALTIPDLLLPSHKKQTSYIEMRNTNQCTYMLSITRKTHKETSSSCFLPSKR